MKKTCTRVSAIGALLLACGALAAPTVKHETCSAHFPTENIWTSSSSWVGAPPPAQTTSNAVLTTGWTLDTPSDVAAYMMFDYVAMDDAMNPISVHTIDDVAFYQVQITRSAPGTPLSMDMTIDSEVLSGDGGFLMELAEPLVVSMQRVGFSGTGVPGEFVALYQGVYSSKRLLITDPGIDMRPRMFEVTDPTLMEIELLTDQGPCSAADLAEPFGQLTFADISAFLGAFTSGTAAADLAEPFGQLTFADISAFLASFAGGCP